MNMYRGLPRLGMAVCCLLLALGCRQGPREAPIVGSRSDPPVSCGFRWQPNKRYTLYHEIYQSIGSERTFSRATPPTEISVELALLATTSNAPNGNVGMEMEILSLAMDITSGERFTLHYDSANKATPNEGAGLDLFEGVAGTRIRFLIGQDNQVLQMDGLKELNQHVQTVIAAARATGRSRTIRAYSGWTANVARMLCDATCYRQVIESSGWPNRPVKIGEQWTVLRSWPTGMGGRMMINAQHTFRGWQERDRHKCVRIDIAEQAAPASQTAVENASGRSSTMANQPATGTVWLDPALAFPVESTFERGYKYSGIDTVVPKSRGTNSVSTNVQPVLEKYTTVVSQRVTVRLGNVIDLEPPPPNGPKST